MIIAPTTERLPHSNERGSVLVVVLTLVLAVLYLGVLMVDLSRAERLMRILQRSADAASLAGASELVLTAKPDNERWTKAKRAAMASLRLNLNVSGYDFPDITIVGTHQGIADSCEAEINYKPEIYDNGDYRITFERGNYSDDGTGTFIPMEDSATCRSADHPTPNAMRVRILAYGYPVMLGGIFGFRSMGNLSTSAIGAHIDRP